MWTEVDLTIQVEIYSKDNCQYCVAAIQLTESRGYDLTIKKLGEDFNREDLLEEFPNARTYPQIKVNGEKVGGFDDFYKHLRTLK